MAQTATKPAATVQELNHNSMVLGGPRAYRAIVPPSYRTGTKRYPVIYWLHGYEPENEEREHEIADYVAAHDVIVVESGPVETTGAYPLYFSELAEAVDKSLRTVADRDHRGVTGVALGGFMAFWVAGKYPDWVSSASNFMGTPEANVGPKEFTVEYNPDDFYRNYDGVRTRLVCGSRDPFELFHRRMDALWLFGAPHHETERFDSDHATDVIPKTLDFHLKAFATPLPKPTSFTHADAYPNFQIWGWEVASNRRQPGFTMLENVSLKGFRSSVREWVGGAAIPEVKLSISTPRLYPPASMQTITYLRLRDGNLRKITQKADAQGRLNLEMDGDAYEVGVSAEGEIAVTGYSVADASWATAGQPVNLRVKFTNKGAARSATVPIQWESPNQGVKFTSPASRLFGLAPGESVTIPVSFTVVAQDRALVRIVAIEGSTRTPIDIPLFPKAPAQTTFEIADGRAVKVFRRGTHEEEATLGDGNGDGHAAPGESFALLIPDGGGLRAAEVFTGDACVEPGVRASDSWKEFESVPYSLPTIREDCAPGTRVHLLARVTLPGYQVKYYAIEIPVWYRRGEEPKKLP